MHEERISIKKNIPANLKYLDEKVISTSLFYSLDGTPIVIVKVPQVTSRLIACQSLTS